VSVTLLYFAGCPNWKIAEERLRLALSRCGNDTPVTTQAVETQEEALALGLTGSPTILLDGHDPFGDPSAVASLSCRLYPTPDGLAGSPTIEQLLEVLR
jgi:hypothetical protein